ncbi:3,4-dihydroxy-2-butanone 4-phosphate synthase [Gautieria morchelliformis]|nr:3,4-dihydroxy-2-butanone 4-phosphate synthase [Gautieria morchelliformis]
MARLEKPNANAQFQFDDIDAAMESFARGEFLMVLDDENRENEGDLICAASLCTTEKMAWLIKHSSGYVCIALPPARLEQLEIPMMVQNNQERHRTAYAVTVDYKQGTTTGISAHDRALTARKLAYYPSLPLTGHASSNGKHEGACWPSQNEEVSNPPSAESFSRPGHMVPLRARSGGVLRRKGHTEAALDLCILTSLPPAGILCELVNDNPQGSMARRDDCRQFADRWGIKMISIEQLVMYRLEHPSYVSPFVSDLAGPGEDC